MMPRLLRLVFVTVFSVLYLCCFTQLVQSAGSWEWPYSQVTFESITSLFIAATVAAGCYLELSRRTDG